ncbi:MAG: prepilin-type N-terminal cleavage/methylation domain-containing protein [Pyrinomonadaceae bacterium]|nr:prepilin-type N-terminal cleavage/methylation domain-containing protein [Pyrinomonadaceae bacterium]
MSGNEIDRRRGRRFDAAIDESSSRVPALLRLRTSASAALGFTLLELMIVISIVVILASVALPQYQKATRHARETVLRDDLFQMRKLIDQYAADKGKLPQSLDELVTAGYLREIPEDPITGERNWTVEMGEDTASLEGSTGITNVRSTSSDTASDGRPYSEW